MNIEPTRIEPNILKLEYPWGISKLLEQTEQRRLDSIYAAAPYDPNGHYMSLTYEPCSYEARNLSHHLACMVYSHLNRKHKPNKTMISTMGSVLSHLLQSMKDEDGYCYRSVGSDSFNNIDIGQKAFTDTVTSLESLGLIKIIRGIKSKDKKERGKASRFEGGKLLQETFCEWGMHPEDWEVHFRSKPRPSKIGQPVVVKKCSTKEYGNFGEKIRGRSMTFNKSHPKAMESATKINALNAHWSNNLTSANHYAFHRIFNMGNHSTFDFDKGGRIYSLPMDSTENPNTYQNMSQQDRSLITINGERTVEVDVKCSHPNVLAALLGTYIPAGFDIYESELVPRAIMKLFVTQLLGSNRLPTSWSAGASKSYNKRIRKEGDDRTLSEAYKFKLVKSEALRNFPSLADWDSIDYRWGDLQFIESEAILDAVYILATKYDVPALPVHDSLIVPESMVETAKEVITDCFERHIGFTPTLELK